MSVEQSGVIDIISTRPDGTVVLTISDHLSWEVTGHLQMLQEKINDYLRFIEGGQIYEDYSSANGSSMSISVVVKYELNQSATDFLKRCKAIINDAGIGFEWQRISDEEKHAFG